jgi:putative transposase
MLKVKVLAANLSDREGGKQLLEAVRGMFPRLRHLFADGGYAGPWVQWVQDTLGWTVDIVQRPGAGLRGIWWPQDEPLPEAYMKLLKGFRDFVVIPRRWVVERTFAWLSFQRRLVKDYEYLPETSEALIYGAMIRILLRRLAA